jgi:hypothetical protein
MILRGIIGLTVGCILSVIMSYIFSTPSDVSFYIGIGCGVICSGIALSGNNIKFFILRGKFTKDFFGVQLVCGRYKVQYAFCKFGIYNSRTCKWWPS